MRIRTIKPEFWRHEVMAQLPPETQLMGIALLNMADDEGYFEANPRIVRGEVMPFRDDLATVSRDLRELARAGWIEVRDTSGHGHVGLIVNWAKHQRVDHPKKSKLAVYFSASDSREAFAPSSREPRDASREEQGTGNREVEQGSGGGGVARSTPPPPPKSRVPVVYEAPTKDIELWQADDFFAWAQWKRQEAGLVGEVQRPRDLNAWFSTALMTLNGNTEALREAFFRFGEDKFWQAKTPALPFAGFISQWDRFVPRGAVHAQS